MTSRSAPREGVRLFSRKEVARLLPFAECVGAVERALIAHAEGRTLPPAVLSVHAGAGGFHVKAAGLRAGEAGGYLAAKLNANFPENPERHGLPAIQGVIALCDAGDGRLLALLDSIEITILRTGAATALAAARLALPGDSTAAILGCGTQGRIQIEAFAAARPIRSARAWDRDPRRAVRFCAEVASELGIPIEPAASAAEAVRGARMIATCTPAQAAILDAAAVSPGAFIAAVGADNPRKQEIDPLLFGRAAIVVDDLEQCAAFGDLAHALRAGTVRREQVRGELPFLLAGRHPGRLSEEEILVFDSTGTGLQDLGAAVAVFEKGIEEDAGIRFDFDPPV